ncbi:MAG TPA: hypothetical protein VJQ46_13820, partial [Gemmatimonadales bacterium]|nr:hypothetical protein [Gemmatimonadales bacterium]
MPAPSSAAPDSLAILRSARKAQRDFELFHRTYLPDELDGGDHPCDERIGRYCYWYQPASGPAPPEVRAVRVARGRLLGALSAA